MKTQWRSGAKGWSDALRPVTRRLDIASLDAVVFDIDALLTEIARVHAGCWVSGIARISGGDR